MPADTACHKDTLRIVLAALNPTVNRRPNDGIDWAARRKPWRSDGEPCAAWVPRHT